MAKNVRERMVAGATELLATKGLQATSFSEVIELTGTPRGSIYHHFPGGKDELVLAALQMSREQLTSMLGRLDRQRPDVLLATWFEAWRELLTSSDYGSGCAAVAVTVATESDELRAASGECFTHWVGEIAQLFTAAGMASDQAADFAGALLAATEGAIVMARATRGLDGFERVERQMTCLLESQLGVRAAA